MTDDAASDWLAVAAGELSGYSKMIVEAGLSDARRNCTHHGQIIPHAIKYMEENFNFRIGKPLPRHLPSAPVNALPPAVAGLIGQASAALKRT